MKLELSLQVRGYPTIKYFPAGKKDDAQEYDGGRTSSDIVQWALDKFAENVPPPEVYEVSIKIRWRLPQCAI